MASVQANPPAMKLQIIRTQPSSENNPAWLGIYKERMQNFRQMRTRVQTFENWPDSLKVFFRKTFDKNGIMPVYEVLDPKPLTLSQANEILKFIRTNHGGNTIISNEPLTDRLQAPTSEASTASEDFYAMPVMAGERGGFKLDDDKIIPRVARAF